MDNKKIDIIVCGNNKEYLDEQRKYIENLIRMACNLIFW